jgi:hypothetical protein
VAGVRSRRVKAAESISGWSGLQGGLSAGVQQPEPGDQVWSRLFRSWIARIDQLELFEGQQAVPHASTTGKLRGPGKTEQSGIFVQTTHFPGLFYFPQPRSRYSDA